MTEISFPYGKTKLKYSFADDELAGVLLSSIEDYRTPKSENELVLEAMESPAGGVTLSNMARGKNKVTLIASDHTRPVPSRVIIPHMLREIREGNDRR